MLFFNVLYYVQVYELACTIGVYCRHVLYLLYSTFFCTIGEEIYTIWGLLGLGGGGGVWGGG